MKYILFEKAGKPKKTRTIFLTSENRRYKEGASIFHRNDFHTHLRMPIDFYKNHFSFERWTGIYRTHLSWNDVMDFCEVIKL